MGLRALYNGVIRFHNVEVPAENIILAPGKGMRVAFTPSVWDGSPARRLFGLAYESLKIARLVRGKKAMGIEIGKHEAIASKLADMAADAYATDSMVRMTSALVDAKVGFRMESALCKLWGTETALRVVDDSHANPWRPWLRDRPFARQPGGQPRTCRADDAHSRSTVSLRDPLRSCVFTSPAKPSILTCGLPEVRWIHAFPSAPPAHCNQGGHSLFHLVSRTVPAQSGHLAKWNQPRTRKALRYVERTSRRLSRSLFHAMALYGPPLKRGNYYLAGWSMWLGNSSP